VKLGVVASQVGERELHVSGGVELDDGRRAVHRDPTELLAKAHESVAVPILDALGAQLDLGLRQTEGHPVLQQKAGAALAWSLRARDLRQAEGAA